jgi:hypothetical protein
MKALGLVLGFAVLAGAAGAETVQAERAKIGAVEVTLYPYEFLNDEELAALRLVLTNDQALALFIPGKGGHAALAVSPDDGFIRDGALVKSAVALAELPDAAKAEAEVLKACNAVKSGNAACVVVLTVAPSP